MRPPRHSRHTRLTQTRNLRFCKCPIVDDHIVDGAFEDPAASRGLAANTEHAVPRFHGVDLLVDRRVETASRVEVKGGLRRFDNEDHEIPLVRRRCEAGYEIVSLGRVVPVVAQFTWVRKFKPATVLVPRQKTRLA